MKVYIYSEAMDKIGQSGVGRAIFHQTAAVQKNGVEVVNSVEEADVVHINTVLPKSFQLARELNKKGVPLVYHAHSTKEDFRNSYIGANAVAGLFKQWIIKCYSKGDVIITPSKYSKHLLESYGIKKPIFAISNGIDLDDYQRNEQAGKEFREKYGFSNEDKVVISAGLIMKRKGVHDFAEIARRLPQYKFIWFGAADMRFVGKEVRNAVNDPPENLIFAGYVEKPKLQAALSGSDLFLFPSYEETEGIVVLEALAMKTPVLLRKIPVYDGWIYNGEKRSAYLAENTEDFVRLTTDILEERLPSLVEKGYAVAQSRSLERTGAQLAAAYKRAIELCEKNKSGK